MLDRGYTVVATDYLGMGIETVDGKQAGLGSCRVGDTAARSVLGSVRAAQQREAAQAGASSAGAAPACGVCAGADLASSSASWARAA